MKKRVLLVILLTAVCFGTFAEIGIGASAYYPMVLALDHQARGTQPQLEYYSFGASLQWKQSILLLDTLAMFDFLGQDNVLFNGYADVGLGVTLFFLRISAAVGVNISRELASLEEALILEEWTGFGFNAKLNGDIKLGRISLGVSLIVPVSFKEGFSLLTFGDDFRYWTGTTLMIWL